MLILTKVIAFLKLAVAIASLSYCMAPFPLSICNCGKDYSLDTLLLRARPCCWAWWLESKEQSSEGVQCIIRATVNPNPNPNILAQQNTTVNRLPMQNKIKTKLANRLGWVGLGVTTGRGSKTRSKIFSLASNHQFTHFDFTSGGVIPGKIPLHSHVCTGEFTQTGVTLTVFFYNIQFDTVFTLIHKNLGKVPKNPKKNLVQYLL